MRLSIRVLSTLLLLAGPPISHTSAAEIDVTSLVVRVTVFQHSAEVTRHSTTEVPAGDNTIIFTGVPSTLNADSVRVAGRGNGKISISGVEYKTRFLKDELSVQAKELDQKIKTLERDVALLQVTKTRLEMQKQLVSNVSLDSTVPSEKGDIIRPRSPQEMAQVLSFIGDAGTRLDTELYSIGLKIDDLNENLAVMRQQRSSVKSGGKQESVISVKLDAITSGKIELDLTYQISGASWRPTYNLHVNDSRELAKFQLETYALVQQSTGEDWQDIDLSLSTAMAHIGLTRPIPSPRILDLVTEMPMQADGVLSADTVRGGVATAPASAMRLRRQEKAMEENSGEMEALQEETAQLDKLGMYLFKVPRKATVMSSRSQEKFKLGSTAITGNIVNIAVPALQQHVYREALVKNSTGAPLLPGTINVFADGAFIGKQSLQFIQPEREVRLSVGLSDSIVVTRKLAKRYEEDPGVLRSFRRISTAYDINVENLSASAQEVRILEPAPHSRNEKVKVTFSKISPATLEHTDPQRIEKEEGVLEWKLNQAPKTDLTLQYEAQIEFEASLKVSGLDDI